MSDSTYGWVRTFVLSPAAGRDYATKGAVVRSWNKEDDFTIETIDGAMGAAGRRISAPQVPKGSTVRIKYDHRRKTLEFEA